MAQFNPRTDSSGMQGSSYYYSANPFYQAGYGLPNCTAYAWGRFYEITGVRPKLSTGNAYQWWGYTADGYARGQTPKLGAVMCWYYTPGGHVGVVEKIYENGDVLCSMSGYSSGIYFWTERITKASGYNRAYNPSGAYFQGFIYCPTEFADPDQGLRLINWIPG